MTELDPLLTDYLARGWPLFVCDGNPRHANTFKKPLAHLCPNGLLDATRNPALIAEWLQRSPMALIAIRCGVKPAGAGICVLDVDTKPGKFGRETMRELGFAKPPMTPRVITSTGGSHFYFLSPREGFGNTQGDKGRGIGLDVDWRGNGGYVCAPGGLNALYRWDPRRNLQNCPLLPVPPELLPRPAPREPEPAPGEDRGAVVFHPDRYVAAMMARACREIAEAGDGVQHATLNGVAYNIARTASRRHLIPEPLIRELIAAGCSMHAYRPREPWTRKDVERTVRDGWSVGWARG